MRVIPVHNKSVESRAGLADWRETDITPIYKKGMKSNRATKGCFPELNLLQNDGIGSETP
jgi:hypothetical protein